MSRLKLYTSIVSTVCMLGVVGMPVGVRADGDPTEVTAEEIVEAAAATADGNGLRPDEQSATADEAVATVTADGDFLLPTYLLPGESATIERTTTVEETYEPQPQPETVIKTVKRETVKPQKPARETAQEVVRERVETVVEQREEMAPQAQTTKRIIAQEDELEELLKQTAPQPVVQLGTGHRKAESAPAKKLLIPLAPVAVEAVAEPVVPAQERAVVPSEYANQMVDSLKSGEDLPFLMPHEIRITFYPHESAFSGQALKWVKAFALAALQDPRLVVEVRASCAEADLQERRLLLVKDALRGAGLSTHQIVVNYTNRPVDTMLLRAVPRVETADLVVAPKDQKLPKNMSQVKKW